MEKGIKKFIGDKTFYKMALAIIIPVVIQQLILSIAGYVDNLMISSFSQEAYAGVSTANRFMFLINFFWIGLASTISVFIAQYYGAKDNKRVSATIQLSVIIAIIVGILSIFIIYFAGPFIIKLFIPGNGNEELEAIIHGSKYIKVIALGAVVMLLNFMVSTIYRTIGKPKIPMYSGIVGIVVNILLNFVLIFGLFGVTPMGATGAAVATVISKVVELSILIFIAIFYDKQKYIKQVFKSFHIDGHLFKLYLKKGTPILLNEIMWAVGVQVLARFITGGNYEWLVSFNYSQNVTDLFFIYFGGIATGTSILVGRALGDGDFEKAKDYAYKLIGITVIASLIALVLLTALSPALLLILTPVNQIYWNAYYLILVTSGFIILYAFNALIYFILRAGGDSLRAFLLDQLPTYLVGIPLTFLLYKMEYKWGLGLILIFALSKVVDIIKIFFSFYFFKKETWVQNLTVLTPELL